jgi:hypothetical protein
LQLGPQHSMKLIVETTGGFQVYNPGAFEQFARADRPCVVQQTQFINTHIGNGRLNVLHQVADTATDEELVENLPDLSKFVAKHKLPAPAQKAAAK